MDYSKRKVILDNDLFRISRCESILTIEIDIDAQEFRNYFKDSDAYEEKIRSISTIVGSIRALIKSGGA